VKAPRSRKNSKTTPAAKARAKRASEEVSEEELSEGSGQDDDDATEPADEEYQDDDDSTTSKKRKRGPAKAAANGKNNKAAGKRAPKRNGQTPLLPATKRLRSAISTASRSSIAQATRVLALWKQDSCYYPGTVWTDADLDGLYFIRFDDQTETWVTINQMRALRFRIGDHVLIPHYARHYRVVNVQSEEAAKVQLEYDNEVFDMDVTSLRVANKTISYSWGDRILDPQLIQPVVRQVKTNLSPSPSKMSMLSVASARSGRQKVLSKTGLIVTLTATGGNWEKGKENVMSAVKNSGGTVIDDLNGIFRMEGKHSQNNNRWIIHDHEFKWLGDESIHRLFLLADEPNQKPKFLIALALGIPCLNTTWLQDSVECVSLFLLLLGRC